MGNLDFMRDGTRMAWLKAMADRFGKTEITMSGSFKMGQYQVKDCM